MRLPALILLCACALAQTSTVAIVDTGIKDATGAAFSGDFVLTPSSVTPASVSTGPSKITLYVRSGTLSASRTTNAAVALYPGTYTVTKRNSAGVTDTGFLWTVPASGPVAVWQIESRAIAAPTYTFNYGLLSGLSAGTLPYMGASAMTELHVSLGSAGQMLYNSAGTLAASSNALIGENSVTYDALGLGRTYISRVLIEQTVTDTTDPAGTRRSAGFVHLILNPTAAVTENRAALGAILSTPSGNSKTLGSLMGINAGVYHDGSGDTGQIYGGQLAFNNNSTGTILGACGACGYVYNNGTGTITEANAADLHVRNEGAGTLTNSVGTRTSVRNYGGGAIGTAQGVRAFVMNESGTITEGAALLGYLRSNGSGSTIGTFYGLALGTPDFPWDSDGTVTTSYGIYLGSSIDVGATKYAIYSLSTSPSVLSGLLDVSAKGIKVPTSCTGLSEGTLYNNSGNPAFCPAP